MPSLHTSSAAVAPYPLQLEPDTLHPLAIRSKHHRGRQHPSSACALRNEFQRDRDRILHSKAFRRLKHKTQVFISPLGDHYRTRLTHSLEVSQIARTIARALRLNEDFTEAIALGHDLGHPPFGHAGEAVLKQKLSQGFCHSRHSVRIATVLEPLNLTFDVLEAIAQQEKNQQPLTLETRVVELADRMAYLRHDVEDALRAGLLKEQDIPAEIRAELGQTYAERLDTLVKDLVWTSLARLEPLGQQGAEEEAPSLGASAEREVETLIALSPERFQAMQALRGWMFRTIYLSPSQQSKDERVQRVLEALLDYYFTHPDQLPPAPSDEHAGLDEEASEATALEQRVGDYIAGMTDRFALKAYQELLLPQPYGEPLLRF